MIKLSEKSKLTKNFTFKEYAYGIFQPQMEKFNEETIITVEALKHAECLQEFREWLGKPMTVNAWFRPTKFNKSVGGTTTSGHLTGTATDVGMTISEKTFRTYMAKWYEICKAHNCIGAIGWYSNFVHFESQVTWAKNNTYWKQVDGKTIYNF